MNPHKAMLSAFLSFLVFVIVLAVADGASAAPAKAIELVVNNPQAASHHFNVNCYQPWKEYVEKGSNGRITVTIFNGGVLGDNNSALDDLSGNMFDVCSIIAPSFYDTELFPYSISVLPYAFPDSKTAARISNEFLKKYVQSDEVIFWGAIPSDPFQLFSTRKINSYDDFKNMKMRISGKGDAGTIGALGATPVTLSPNELYEALQKGVVEGSNYSVVGSLGVKVYEPAPYVCLLGVYRTCMAPAMSRVFYNKLPADLQKMFDEDFGPKLVELFINSYAMEYDRSMEQLKSLVEGKGEVYTLPDADMEKVYAAAEIQWAQWVKDANARGYDGQKMMAEFKALLAANGIKVRY